MRRIEARIRVRERIRVHVAGGGPQRRRPRPQHVRRRAVARRPLAWVGCAGRVLHHRDEGVGSIDLRVAARGGGHRRPAAVVVGAGGAAPGQLHGAGLVGAVEHAVEVAQPRGVLRRVDGAGDDDAVVHHRGDAVEALTAVVGQPEAAQVLVAHCGRAAASASHLQLQVAEAVEWVGASAGGDAAAVLRPGRGVLDIPELAVCGGHGRDRGGGRQCEQGDDGHQGEATRERHVARSLPSASGSLLRPRKGPGPVARTRKGPGPNAESATYAAGVKIGRAAWPPSTLRFEPGGMTVRREHRAPLAAVVAIAIVTGLSAACSKAETPPPAAETKIVPQEVGEMSPEEAGGMAPEAGTMMHPPPHGGTTVKAGGSAQR